MLDVDRSPKCCFNCCNIFGEPYCKRRVAALGEALSHAFRLTLVQTVPRRFLTLSYALSRPSERQRRSTRSPRRPDRFSCRHSGDPGVGKGAQDGQEKRPELRGELHLAAFSRLYGRPRLLYCARRSRHARTRARASLQRRFRTGMHQSLLIYASREQHRVCSG